MAAEVLADEFNALTACAIHFTFDFLLAGSIGPICFIIDARRAIRDRRLYKY